MNTAAAEAAAAAATTTTTTTATTATTTTTNQKCRIQTATTTDQTCQIQTTRTTTDRNCRIQTTTDRNFRIQYKRGLAVILRCLWYRFFIPLRVASSLLSLSFSSLSIGYSDTPCSWDRQEDPGGETLSIHRACDLELSSPLCQTFLFLLFFYQLFSSAC